MGPRKLDEKQIRRDLKKTNLDLDAKLDVIVLFLSEICLLTTINFRSSFLKCKSSFHMPQLSHSAIFTCRNCIIYAFQKRFIIILL